MTHSQTGSDLTAMGDKSLGCARCGHCCAPITLSWQLETVTRYANPELQNGGIHDPRTKEGWATWLALGWKDDDRKRCIARCDDVYGTIANATFLKEHWTQEWVEPRGRVVVTCDMYDADTRLCTAGDSRPPICSKFPWYDREPYTTGTEGWGREGVEDGPGDTRLGCSFLLDLPPAERPAGVRPLIPLEVLNA